jgi:hypothetical protein
MRARFIWASCFLMLVACGEDAVSPTPVPTPGCVIGTRSVELTSGTSWHGRASVGVDILVRQSDGSLAFETQCRTLVFDGLQGDTQGAALDALEEQVQTYLSSLP